MWHRVEILGNLGRDPESRYLESGKMVTNFSVATSEKWTGQDGQKQEKTVWWKIAAFGKLAENCNQYLGKGSKVLVVGKMQATKEGNPRTWQGKDGQTQASFELVADTVIFLSPKGEASAREAT